MENVAVPAVGNLSKEELLKLKEAMNAKALAKRRTKTALRVAANVVFAVLILLPLLYAISIALMPSNELFRSLPVLLLLLRFLSWNSKEKVFSSWS